MVSTQNYFKMPILESIHI